MHIEEGVSTTLRITMIWVVVLHNYFTSAIRLLFSLWTIIWSSTTIWSFLSYFTILSSRLHSLWLHSNIIFIFVSWVCGIILPLLSLIPISACRSDVSGVFLGRFICRDSLSSSRVFVLPGTLCFDPRLEGSSVASDFGGGGPKPRRLLFGFVLLRNFRFRVRFEPPSVSTL